MHEGGLCNVIGWSLQSWSPKQEFTLNVISLLETKMFLRHLLVKRWKKKKKDLTFNNLKLRTRAQVIAFVKKQTWL